MSLKTNAKLLFQKFIIYFIDIHDIAAVPFDFTRGMYNNIFLGPKKEAFSAVEGQLKVI